MLRLSARGCSPRSAINLSQLRIRMKRFVEPAQLGGLHSLAFHTSEIVNYEKVLNFADRALGEAKRAGKNRAVGLLPTGDELMPTLSQMVHPGYIAGDVLAIVSTTGHPQE